MAVPPLQSPGRTEDGQAPSRPGLLPLCSLTPSLRLGVGAGLPCPPPQPVGLLAAMPPPPDARLDLQGPLSSHFSIQRSGRHILGSEVAGPGLELQAAEPTEPSGSSGCFLLVAPQNLWASPSKCRALGSEPHEAVFINAPQGISSTAETLAHPEPSLDRGDEGSEQLCVVLVTVPGTSCDGGTASL